MVSQPQPAARTLRRKRCQRENMPAMHTANDASGELQEAAGELTAVLSPLENGNTEL